MGNVIKKIKGKLLKNLVGSYITDGRADRIHDITDYRYKELRQYLDSVDEDTAVMTMQNLFRFDCGRIKKQKHAKVGFLVYSSSEWQCEQIYRMMEEDDFYDPHIVICGYRHGTPDSIENVYRQTADYFKKAGRSYAIDYIGFDDKENADYEKIISSFDILFYITPYECALIPDYANARNRSLNQLIIYVPYSYDFTPALDRYTGSVFTCAMINVCVSEIDRMICTKKTRLKGYNAYYCGFPKLDDYKKLNANSAGIWKTTDETKCRIFYAPHWDMATGGNSTFALNHDWFYEYAKAHSEISWIIKPHPRMEWGCMEYGVFKSGTEYRDYLKKWDELPNASVRTLGDYYDIFATSDTMILDSISFVAEYQVTGKPLLFLTPEVPSEMNELGDIILDNMYKCKGNDFKGIESYINELWREDPMKAKRDRFREENFSVDICGNSSRKVMELISERIKGGENI